MVVSIGGGPGNDIFGWLLFEKRCLGMITAGKCERNSTVVKKGGGVGHLADAHHQGQLDTDIGCEKVHATDSFADRGVEARDARATSDPCCIPEMYDNHEGSRSDAEISRRQARLFILEISTAWRRICDRVESIIGEPLRLLECDVCAPYPHGEAEELTMVLKEADVLLVRVLMSHCCDESADGPLLF